MANAEAINIEVVYALPDEQVLLALTLPADSTIPDAVRASGLATRFPEIQNEATRYGIFGKIEKDPATRTLHAGDRVEIYRPLLIDPKEARKARAAKAKAKRQ
ncbi:MAG: RnfH family protein [Moraxellaceae bacterium]